MPSSLLPEDYKIAWAEAERQYAINCFSLLATEAKCKEIIEQEAAITREWDATINDGWE